MIFIEKDHPLTRDEVDIKLNILRQAVEDAENRKNMSVIKQAMKKTVDTYQDADEINKKAEHAEEMKQVSNSAAN